MKKQIKKEDIEKFKRDSNIFAMLFFSMIILCIPLNVFMGIAGSIICIIMSIVMFYYAIKIEKQKKEYDIQTYQEIAAFLNEEELDDDQKHLEVEKRVYQKFLVVTGVTLLAIIISAVIFFILIFIF